MWAKMNLDRKQKVYQAALTAKKLTAIEREQLRQWGGPIRTANSRGRFDYDDDPQDVIDNDDHDDDNADDNETRIRTRTEPKEVTAMRIQYLKPQTKRLRDELREVSNRTRLEEQWWPNS